MPPDIKKAIFGAKSGDITEILRVPNRYYIFKVDTVRHKTLEEVRPTLYDELRGDILNKYLTGLFEGIDVKILDEAAFKQAAAE
jgi:parvulin-like peptidyl-prolyl isomerase